MNYPNHKHSKFIDQGFSFNNVVDYPSKVDMVDALKFMRCDGGIMLEPRLQEYLRKKKYYLDNNIEPCIKLEEEYLITSRDKKMLKAFLNGRKDIYDTENPEFNPYIREKKQKKKYFPSKGFREDPRVQKIEKPVMNKPVNRGMFAPERGEIHYEDNDVYDVDPIMSGRDLCDGGNALSNFESDLLSSRQDYSDFRDIDFKGYGINDMGTFNPRNDRRIDPGYTKQNKYESQYRIDPHYPKDRKTYRIDMDPRNKHIISNLNKKNKLDSRESLGNLSPFGSNSMENYAIPKGKGRDDRYGHQEEPNFSGSSNMDIDLKVVTPDVSTRGKRGQSTFNYHMGPFLKQDEGIRDAEFETALQRGMPSHTTKSYGYRQPFENQFDYVDMDFNGPDTSVLPFPRGGESTRRNDKSLAKQKFTREIY
jgi:hypothetical protein